MSSKLEKLIEYFPSGTAEGDRAILDQVFIYADEFSQIISPPVGNPYLLVGDKGSGKSALIDFSAKLVEKSGIPAVVLTPFDIDTSSLVSDKSTGDMTRDIHGILLSSITSKLASINSGLFDGDYTTLYDDAVVKGLIRPDVLSRIAKFLSQIAKPITKVDISETFPLLWKNTSKEVADAAAKIIGKNSFYLFIDDTDQIASPEKPGHLNRIWALILAVRRLSSLIPELKAIVCLRTEVWQRLQSDIYGQRDQTDHFKSLTVRMKSSREHVGQIIERRMTLAAANIPHANGIYQNFFEGHLARAPYSEHARSWRDLLLVRTRERPRDAIQLVNALATMAIEKKKAFIDEHVFQIVMPSFSKTVAEQFAQEVSPECPQSMQILKSFASVEYNEDGFTLTSEGALAHFKSLFSRFGIQLSGTSLPGDNELSAFEIWSFFYRCSVLNARVSDKMARNGYRHLKATEDPTLVTKANWNRLQQILWEVDTAYRDYLISLQKEDQANTGLPVKRRNKKKTGR